MHSERPRQVLTVERSDHVATVWLDRPEARNAMGQSFWRELPLTMAELSGDHQVRAVVVAARGPHFSVGLDLKEMGQLLSGERSSAGAEATPVSPGARAFALRRSIVQMQAAVSSVADCPKPVIAAIHGYCIGGGVDLITACDIRVAAEDAVFSVRETKMAIVADLGSLQRLPQIVGQGHVAELAYSGRDIGAQRALRIGLVNDVHTDAPAAIAAAHQLATEIAANSPLVVQGTKTVLRAGEDRTVAEGLDYVATFNAGMLQTDDLVEAMTAFVQKRPPHFRGS